jgi:hypothetical protein
MYSLVLNFEPQAIDDALHAHFGKECINDVIDNDLFKDVVLNNKNYFLQSPRLAMLLTTLPM